MIPTRIKDKIKEIEEYLVELDIIIPTNFKQYQKNLEKKAACERYFEKIIEASIDLAFLVIKYKKLKIPEDDINSLQILFDNKYINEESFKSLKLAKAMRNILAHQYGSIDDEIVFETISKQLKKDIKKYLKQIKTKLKNGK